MKITWVTYFSRRPYCGGCFAFQTIKNSRLSLTGVKNKKVLKGCCFAKENEKNSENQNQTESVASKPHFDFKKRTEEQFKNLLYEDQKEILKVALKAGRSGSIGDYNLAFYQALRNKVYKLNPSKKEKVKSKLNPFISKLPLPWMAFFWAYFGPLSTI